MTRRKPDMPLAASQTAAPTAADADSRKNRLRPWLLAGMTALLVARPLFPSESAASFGDGLPAVMLWIALAAFWLIGAVGRPTFSVRFGWTDAAVLLLIVWHSAAALLAVAQGSPRPALNMLWEWVGMGLCFFLVRQLVTTSREARAVVAVMIALAVGVSGYGLYQSRYEMPQTRAEYRANPDRAMRETGFRFPPGSPERKLFEDRLQNTEPTATFALTNSLAGFLAPWLAIAAGVVAGSLQNRKRLAVCLIPIAACLLLTKSRSGYAAACVGIGLAWWMQKGDAVLFRPKRIGWKWPAAVAGVAALLVAAALAVEGSSLVGRTVKSFGYRVQYWQSSLMLIGDHPWFGCGPGNFQSVYTQYKLPEASEEIADPHNFLLEIGATAGVPAALLFLVVLGCFGLSVPLLGTSSADRDSTPPQHCLFQAVAHAANPQSPIPNPSLDACPSILVGGAVGFPLAMLLGMLGQAPSGMAMPLIGLPLAAATVLLLSGWIQKGQLPGWLPAVGIAALLVDLLAASGIGLPSVAGTFWLLLALGLEGRRPHELRPFAAWAALTATMLLAVACYDTAYRPVLNCQTELHLAERDGPRAAEHLEAAAAADPLSAEPWRLLAGVEFDVWQRQPNPENWRRFTRARENALALAPNSASLWLAAGDWTFLASSKKDESGNSLIDDALTRSVDFYRRSVTLYPNSAIHRARLAEALSAAGDRDAFRREAEAALRLDAMTPHLDKKLPDDLRKRLSRGMKQGILEPGGN